ncbi:hypothetical protein [Streptomyces aurantiogriseus]|uniref:DUF1440 domain-containing protein n=1 Tax=Streptomyces aurantiogriseus TaxID=66870 RepID=A0A918KZL2_9ACTN|nr:hypothetical protein [Streptomyces aurantiogriseus]GGR58168.1 hypothetical protein GCM10010251_88740 [Streptomyces aurantiogriseus]
MTEADRRPSALLRAGARGLVAAMAMTGIRTVTTTLAPQQKSPPEAIVERFAPTAVLRSREHRREAVTELLHWTYGATGGAVFGLLPARLRGMPMTGPAYGLLVWLGFELAVAPALGVQRAEQRRALWRVVVALDHMLYGVVVAGRLAPEPAVTARTAEAVDDEDDGVRR